MAKKPQHGGKRPGAGRPLKDGDKRVVIGVSVPESLATALDNFAEAKGWSRSKAVTVAMRALIKGKLG
jgi:hypothetical protein